MERPKYGLYLGNLTQDTLDKIVVIYDEVIQPPPILKRMRRPLAIRDVSDEIHQLGVVERRWGSKNSGVSKFLIERYRGGNNPLLRFTYDPNYTVLPKSTIIEGRDLIAIYEEAVSSYLAKTGLARELT